MKSKFIIITIFAITLLGSQVSSCSQQMNNENERVSLGGTDHRTNLVVFFKKGTTNDEVNAFGKDTLLIDKYNLALKFRVINGDYEGVGVSFSTDSTLEQKEELKKNIKESPIVYKVYENVAPSEIKNL